LLDAEHYAYHRLTEPITHRRIITFVKTPGLWTIRDIFAGQGSHLFEFFFNFDAGLDVSADLEKRAIGTDGRARLTIVPECRLDFEARVEPRQISPSYGTCINSSAIIYLLTAKAPFEMNFRLLVSESREPRS
jgi:hypothetical protein